MDAKAELVVAADEAFRFLAGLNLQDHSADEQRKMLSVIRTLKAALVEAKKTPAPAPKISIWNRPPERHFAMIQKSDESAKPIRSPGSSLNWDQIEQLSKPPARVEHEVRLRQGEMEVAADLFNQAVLKFHALDGTWRVRVRDGRIEVYCVHLDV